MEERKIEFRSGDILFIRVGFTKAYDELPPHELQDFFVKANSHFVGLEATKDSLRWLWEKQFAAVASDSPAFERGPVNASFNHPDVNIHQWCLGGWGLPIGELFDLEKLAQECRRLDRWSFFVSSIPLKVNSPSEYSRFYKLTNSRYRVGLRAHRMLSPYSDFPNKNVVSRFVSCIEVAGMILCCTIISILMYILRSSCT